MTGFSYLRSQESPMEPPSPLTSLRPMVSDVPSVGRVTCTRNMESPVQVTRTRSAGEAGVPLTAPRHSHPPTARTPDLREEMTLCRPSTLPVRGVLHITLTYTPLRSSEGLEVRRIRDRSRPLSEAAVLIPPGVSPPSSPLLPRSRLPLQPP